jgi:hypothetical protein
MEALEIDSDRVVIRLSQAELGLLNNALNEVTHGVRIADFEFKARLGESREDAQGLLHQIGGVYREMG